MASYFSGERERAHSIAHKFVSITWQELVAPCGGRWQPRSRSRSHGSARGCNRATRLPVDPVAPSHFWVSLIEQGWVRSRRAPDTNAAQSGNTERSPPTKAGGA